MLRSLYCRLLRLHPPGFRERFGGEMLSIFDQAAEREARFKLLGDGLVSLARQWALRPEFWYDISPAPTAEIASDGIPSFYTLDPFRPRTPAVVHGLLLTVVVFCLTCFAIRYSWIHVLHVHIPEVEYEAPSAIEPSVPTPTLSEEPETPSGSDGRAAGDAAASSRVASHSENRTRNQDAQIPQKQTPIVTPAPSGGAVNAPLPAAPPLYATQNRAARPVGILSSELQGGAAASSGPWQQAVGGTMAPAPVAQGNLDAAERQRVIDGAIAQLANYYVDATVAQKMIAALRAHDRSGDYNGVTNGSAFADLLTRQMQDVSHDNYVVMVYGASISSETPRPPTAEDISAYLKEMESTNCRFEIARVLPHNIGYLKFNSFPDTSICGSRAAAAMAKLNNVNAIIFDVRDNPGGCANMVAFLATYLFDRPTHLNDFYNRGEHTTEQSWTLAPVAGNKLADKPAFVLTSHETFSAAEAFSYDLKMLKRATLVGETTSGHGHMAMGRRIDDHFMIRVPDIKVINPISKTNWEGTGVEPDVNVKAADALATAEKLAQKRIQKRIKDKL
jgi:hypothetical protein